MTKSKIWLSPPHMGDKEREFVKLAFDENWVAPLGPNVDGFEQDLQKYTGVAHAACLSSGTAALHLALIILGIGPGDEVICSTFTFSASANPIVYQGAKPVFVESEKETWNMSPEFLEEAIKDGIKRNKKPKAVVLVHLYGTPARLDEILEICNRYEIPLIEDAAEALGAKYKNKAAGAYGIMSILSFNGNKIITTSGGGALLSDREEYVQKARFLATQARDAAPHYQHSHIGYNYRMSNICAGIGRGQMLVLNERVQKRRTIFDYYSKVFSSIEGISFTKERSDSFVNRWLTCILVDADKTGVSREDMRIALEKENIESRPLWKPMHKQPVFEECKYHGDRTSEFLFRDGLCLPSGTNMQKSDLERISDTLLALLK